MFNVPTKLSILFSPDNQQSIFPHFYVVFIYCCTEYNWNTTRWKLSNNQLICLQMYYSNPREEKEIAKNYYNNKANN